MTLHSFTPRLTTKLDKFGPLLLATIACVAACLAEPFFQSNDDAAIAMVGAGFGLAARPEPMLVFSHPAYGLLLNALSRVVGPTAHGWATMVSVTASLAAMLSFTVHGTKVSRGVLLAIGCSGCVYVIGLLSPQFTITSTLLFAGAVLLALQPEGGPIRLTGSIVMLTLSFLVRPEGFMLGACVGGPAIVALCLPGPELRAARVLLGMIVIVAVVGFATAWLATNASPRWAEAAHYNTLRAQFNDFNRVPWVPGADAFQAAHWTRNDYDIFKNWFSLNPIFDAANLSRIIDALARPASGSWTAGMRVWLDFLFRTPTVDLTVACQTAAWWLLPIRRRKAGLLVLLGEGLALAALAWSGRAPLLWVSTALADIGLLLTVALQSREAIIPHPPAVRGFHPRFLLAVLIAALGIRVASIAVMDHEAARGYAKVYRAWINSQATEFTHPTVAWGDALYWELLITPTRVYPPFPNLVVAGIGAFARSPVQARVRAQLGMISFSRVLCTDPAIRLIAGNTAVDQLTVFCQQHEHAAARFISISSDGTHGIYRLGGTE